MHRRALSLAIALALLTPVVALPSKAAAATWPAGTHKVALSVERLAGPDRYGTAAAVARAGWPGWTGVKRVIIASGETRSYADPLAAGSLCWAYDAPMLLVSGTSVPAAVRSALSEIVAVNGGVDMTVVGGTAAVSSSVVSQLRSLAGTGTVEQPWDGGDRYTTAAGVARRTAQVASETARALPARAFIANGTDAFGFVDALSLSAVSARTGIPVLLSTKDRLPAATAKALVSLPPGDVIAAGSTAAVSSGVLAAAGGSVRWGGNDRYATSVEIAKGARSQGWLTGEVAGIAAAVPDALVGSAYAAMMNGPLLFTTPARLSKSTGLYLSAMNGTITDAVVFGGTPAVSAGVASELAGTPSAPELLGPPPGKYVAKKVPVKVRVGLNTSEVSLYAGSALLATKPISSYGTVDFGAVSAPADGVALRAVAANPDGGRAEITRSFRRLSYPASTSIVIDKSDFRLYFVKGDVLIESYPIAIGRPGMETPTRLWKINAKYHTDPKGVYGPRKMRLFRQSGSGWAYTAYGIHGTNEPWVIGTKASHGCIRLYNADILDLFPQVPLGTLVQTRE